jgi:putative phage-type endonuclease
MNTEQKNLKRLRNRVKALVKKNEGLCPQRSAGWFEARNIAISASEVSACLTNTEEICRPYIEEFNIQGFKIDGKCCSHFDDKEEYIIKKCRSFFGENVFKDSIYTLWGKKYEEIATRFYRQLKNTEVLEFGSLPHSRLNWIRASPDGITPDGVMLEIKCPFSRKINGIVPHHYWQQIQLQLEVADLDVCDFLECELVELENEELYLNFVPLEDQRKGILINILDEPDNSETKYIYPPDTLLTTEQFLEWADQTITQLNLNGKNAKKLYWVIVKWNIIVVNRRKDWFETVKPILKNTHKFFRNFQENPELFNKYKESIHLIKNKKHIDKYNETTCLIHTEFDVEEDFVMDYEQSDQDCLISDI